MEGFSRGNESIVFLCVPSGGWRLCDEARSSFPDAASAPGSNEDNALLDFKNCNYDSMAFHEPELASVIDLGTLGAHGNLTTLSHLANHSSGRGL